MRATADHPIGFAIVRASDQPVRVINSFIVVAAARRSGTGSAFARAIVSSHPGRWTVAHQDRNTAAARFWPAVAATLDPDWTSVGKPVPGRPDAPPDRWISFTVPAAACTQVRVDTPADCPHPSDVQLRARNLAGELSTSPGDL